MMKRFYYLFVFLSFILFSSQKVYGQASFFDARCATDGSMQVVNLQYAQIENNKIPNSGFVDWGWQKPGYHLGIRRIILPDNITEFGEFAFYGLTLETINIPSSLRKLGKNCFDENRWLSVNDLLKLSCPRL